MICDEFLVQLIIPANAGGQNYCVVEGAQFVMEFNSPSQELYDDWIDCDCVAYLWLSYLM